MDPSKVGDFKFSPRFLVLIVLAVLILLGVHYYLTLAKQKQYSLPTPRLSSQIETIFPQLAIVTFRVQPNQVVSYVRTEITRMHPLPPLEASPSSSASSFVFKAEVITEDGQVLYSSWKSFPKVKKGNDNFDLKIMVPYIKQAVLKVLDKGERVLANIILE